MFYIWIIIAISGTFVLAVILLLVCFCMKCCCFKRSGHASGSKQTDYSYAENKELESKRKTATELSSSIAANNPNGSQSATKMLAITQNGEERV